MEPEQRFLPTGTAVCKFCIATKRFAGRDEAGERTFETDWTPVAAWGQAGRALPQALRKGSRVQVIGSLRAHSWESRVSGQKRYKMIIRADKVLFLVQSQTRW